MMADKATPIDTGGQKLHWPAKDDALFRQMETYLAHERSLPPEKQLQDISLTFLENIWMETKAAQDVANRSETDRVKAAAAYRAVFTQAQKLLRQARKALEARYIDDVYPVVDWGFETHLVRGKTVINQPQDKEGWLALLSKYIAHESSLPDAERATMPPYEAIVAVQQTLLATMKKRDEALANRETAVARRRVLVKRLRDMLKAAVLTRIQLHYDGQVSPELQLWGFDVAASSTSSKESGSPETPASE